MGLKTTEAADEKRNSFWRAIVLAEEAPMTAPSPAPAESRRRAQATVGLAIDSQLELIKIVEPVTQSVTAKMGFDEDDTGWIELAVREAVTNAIKHGNRYLADKRVDVQFLIEPDALTIEVRDRGEGFDPTHLTDPVEPENLLKPTGRGILWMRTFMDEVEYATHPEGGAVVRLKKYQRSAKLSGRVAS